MGKRLYTLNENYFNKIDSPRKAYFLGLLYSDGNVYISNDDYINATKLQLSECDKDILEKLSKEINSNKPLRFEDRYSKNPNHSNCYSLDICSKIITRDLVNLGCIPNKSLKLEFPKKLIEDEYISSFIRGYFDGDGCVWEGKRKETLVKDKYHSKGERIRIIHNVKFTITGNVNFIEELQNYLIDNLGFKKTKLNFSKAKERKHICTMEYSGRIQMKKFYDYIYDDSDLYIKRKKEKFEEIINFCALEEKSSSEIGLIAGKPETVISSQASIDNSIVEGSSTIPEMEVESSDSKCPTLSK